MLTRMDNVCFFAFLILLVSASASSSQTCPGAAGCLDPTFGVAGVSSTYVATTDNNLSPGKGAVQADGKILILADAHLNAGNQFTNVVVRTHPDGSLDTSFANAGYLYLSWYGPNNSFANIYGMTLQTVSGDEKIVLAGSNGSSSSLRLERYNSDGTPDLTFGTNGKSMADKGYALAVAAETDGKIVTVGDTGALTRLNLNGTLDTSFASGGSVQISGQRLRTIAVQADGRIVVAGSPSKGTSLMTIFRYNANGSLDSGGSGDSTPGDSFGASGKLTVTFFGTGSTSSATDMKLGSGGKILVGGNATRKNSSNSDFAVARLTSAGQLDSTFGVGGKVTVDIAGFSDGLYGVELQSNGSIVISGSSDQSVSRRDTGIARLTTDGVLDATFGNGGKAVTNFSDGAENFRDAVIQNDPICFCEKIILTGTAETGGLDYAVAARYLL